VSAIGRPNCDRSYRISSYSRCEAKTSTATNLYIISLVIITTLSEQSMCDDTMNIQLVQHGISILHIQLSIHITRDVNGQTLLKLAVNTTIS
jgi:hypothetical protein